MYIEKERRGVIKETRNDTMPRVARLDAPGTLHHVIIRGIKKGNIVRNDEDRKELLL